MTPESEIKELIQSRQYSMTYAEKQNLLLPLLEKQVANCCRSIPAYGNYFRKAGLPVSGYHPTPICHACRSQFSRSLIFAPSLKTKLFES